MYTLPEMYPINGLDTDAHDLNTDYITRSVARVLASFAF